MWLVRKVILPQRASIEQLSHVVKSVPVFSLNILDQFNLAWLQLFCVIAYFAWYILIRAGAESLAILE